MATNQNDDWQDLPGADDWQDVTSGPSDFDRAIAPISKGLGEFLRPVAEISEAMDPYTGAPIRAAIGKTSDGPVASGKAALEQFLAGKVLPTTPTGEELTYRGMTKAGVHPDFAKSTAETVGPVVSGMLDVTALPIGPEVLVGAAKTVAKPISAAGRGASRLIEAGGNQAAKRFFQAGEFLTQGNLDAARSMKATRELKPMEQFFPGTKNFGPSSRSYRELVELRAQAARSPVVSEGGLNAINEAVEKLNLAKESVPEATNANKLIKNLTRRVEDRPLSPGDTGFMVADEYGEFAKKSAPKATVGELDKIIGRIQDVRYTPKGNAKSVPGDIVAGSKEAEAVIRTELDKTDQGRQILAARNKASNLLTAAGKRSNLAEIMANVQTLSDVADEKGLRAFLAKYVTPQAYHTTVGGIRSLYSVPKNVAEKASSLMSKIPSKAYEFGARSGALSTGRHEDEEFDRWLSERNNLE